MNKKVLLAVLIVGILLVTGLLIALSYNGAVTKEQTVNQNLSQIENRYKTKLDILPPLLSVVSNYTAYESGLLTNITELRTRWMDAYNHGNSTAQIQNLSEQLDQKLNLIVATWENYPDLKANQLMQQYMGEVVSQNEQLSFARRDYNGAVRDYNSFIKSFPNNVFAGSFGFKERSYWGTEFPGDPLNT